MIRKKIDTKNTLIRTQSFPSALAAKGGHKVLLGIGGNIGDVVRRFEHLFYYLKRSSFVGVIETAPILKNPPFGYLEQGDFYNSLMLVETHLTPKALIALCVTCRKSFWTKTSF